MLKKLNRGADAGAGVGTGADGNAGSPVPKAKAGRKKKEVGSGTNLTPSKVSLLIIQSLYLCLRPTSRRALNRFQAQLLTPLHILVTMLTLRALGHKERSCQQCRQA